MKRIYTISAQVSGDESVTRDIECESKEKALSLMRSKFPDSDSIQFVSEREVTVEDKVQEEYSRVQSNLDEIDELERKHRQQKNRGLVFIIVGSVLTFGLFLYGWISWLTFAPIGLGIYEYFTGNWGIKRAKKLRSWENDLIGS